MQKIYFDGGCKPNPGKLEVAVVIEGGSRQHERLGHGTSNEAEWIALLMAVDIAIKNGIKCPHFIGDSNMIVKQASGEWTAKDKWVPYYSLFAEQVGAFDDYRVTYIPRADNIAGQYIEEMN